MAGWESIGCILTISGLHVASGLSVGQTRTKAVLENGVFSDVYEDFSNMGSLGRMLRKSFWYATDQIWLVSFWVNTVFPYCFCIYRILMLSCLFTEKQGATRGP